MSATPLSLLDRLRKASPTSADWQRLQTVCLPLIQSWLRRTPGIRDEADDLAQEVFLLLFRLLATFERRRDGSFRAWVRQITVNRIRAFQRTRRKRPLSGNDEIRQFLLLLEDPNSDLSQQWDRDHDESVTRHLLDLVKPDFKPATWQAFTRFALDGRPAAQVARELAISESAVVQAKFRVLKKMREEAGEMLS